MGNPSALVIGSGIGGLFTAYKLAQIMPVTVATKKGRVDSATNRAQGGIAAVLGNVEASLQAHIEDTIGAGGGINDREIVEMVVRTAPTRIRELIQLGVQFTRSEDGEYHLTSEGGHTEARVLHTDDLTGAEIERALVEATGSHPDITVLENTMAIDLLTENKVRRLAGLDELEADFCRGAYLFEQETGEVHLVEAEVIVVATGGCGQIYLHTTNPSIATADGVAMGARAGARVQDMEFIQFHPTSFSISSRETFLISEAVRGEGGILLTIEEEAEFRAAWTSDPTSDPASFSFMRHYDPRGSLATRDIVARAIDEEMKKHGDDHVCLVVYHLDGEFLRNRFPNIYRTCAENEVDLTQQPIPVVPAAHYMVGGLWTDRRGRVLNPEGAWIQGFYCCGEAANTGLHGGNRLASNSLLEAVVFAAEVASDATTYRAANSEVPLPAWDASQVQPLDEDILVVHDLDEVKNLMWNYVGIVRSNLRLERALRRLQLIEEDIRHYYWSYELVRPLLELRNIVMVARLIVESSMARKQNIGLFYNIDLT